MGRLKDPVPGARQRFSVREGVYGQKEIERIKGRAEKNTPAA
jgi:hypothetical protein